MIDLFVLERNLFGNRVSKQASKGKGAHGIASPYTLWRVRLVANH
jgi:hypothetical protein